ncbi:MAG TPA: FecR domain-containing protein [Terriglobia bacterium]|nr:FecR domain-containing protein [Terriglobia bacterium]
MDSANKRKEFDLDRLIAAMRQAGPDEGVVEDAAQRVWTRISGSDSLASNALVETAGQTAHTGQIHGCPDFQSLIPAYLTRSLPEARRLLFEDHVLGCVACRHALEKARAKTRGRESTARPYGVKPRRLNWTLAWGVAAVLVAGIAIGLLGPDRLFLGSGPQATVASVDGGLYRVSDQASVALASGQPIASRAELRTGKASSAVIRLADGSSVEMNERSDLWVSRGWLGTTVHLERGNIIVQAALQRRGNLFVSTRDCLVSVKGTVFAVDRGMKGSRVSVLKGAVRVEHAGKAELLKPGQQLSTESSLAPVPIAEDVSWSRNSAEYLALLGEFSTLHKQFESIPGPSLRYDSRLLKMVPADTVFYAAIPNIGSTLAQANQLFQDRIQQSEVLQRWWKSKQASGEAQKTGEMIDRIRNFSDYLGDEVVIAMPSSNQSPVLLAEVKRSDFRPFLEQQLREFGGQSPSAAPQLLENPAAILPGQPGRKDQPLVLLQNNILAVAADARQMRALATEIGGSGSSGFASTPFYAAIQKAYQSGAGWLLAANMEQILATSVVSVREQNGSRHDPFKDPRLGLADMRYLIVESKDVNGTTQNRATLTFARARQGVAAWLAQPSPMGTLDFVSPKANLAASFVAQSPRDILNQVLSFGQDDDDHFSQQLADFESQAGVNVQDDILGALGGEVTFALDGPVLPTPSWKVILEVNDPPRLESAIEKLVAASNQQPQTGGAEWPRFSLSQQTSRGRTFYDLQVTPPAKSSHPGTMTDINYVFEDGYLVAAANRGLLLSSIENRETGYTLANSTAFSSRLPQDAHTNFSAVFYQNLGAVVGPLAGALESSPALSPAQRQSIQELTANSAPSVICAYGEPSQIVIAGTGSVFGVGLESLFGMHGAGPWDLMQMIEKTNKPASAAGRS